MLHLWFFALWTALALSRITRKYEGRAMRAMYGALIYLAMGAQLFCLYIDGALSFLTALPLHLCSFSAVLALPALLLGHAPLLRFLNRLGRIGAVVALIFPAPLVGSIPLLSLFSFYLLHALLAFLPLPFYNKKEGALGALWTAAVLIFMAAAADFALSANYLFLRAIPAGTPFGFLQLLTLPARAALFLCFSAAVLLPSGTIKRRI